MAGRARSNLVPAAFVVFGLIWTYIAAPAGFAGSAQRQQSSSTRPGKLTARTAAATDAISIVRRRWLRADLDEMASLLDLETNSTATDLELSSLMTEKLKELTKDDALALAKAETEQARARAAELESSLADAEQRAEGLGTALKEIGELVEVGGFAGIFSFFMSEEDMLKETTKKVAELVKKKKG